MGISVKCHSIHSDKDVSLITPTRKDNYYESNTAINRYVDTQ